jgi:hypothetical protein
MVEIIASILFLGSTIGAIAFVAKRMPAAHELPDLAGGMQSVGFFGAAGGWIGAKIKENPYLKDFSWIDFVQKQLLKTRVVVMKAENKINDYMVKLRKRAEDQKIKEEAPLDNYWHDLKTMVKTRKPVSAKDNRAVAEENGTLDIQEQVSIKTETSAHKISESGVRVVLPEDVDERPAHHHKKKRSTGSKKKRFRDPFSW